MIKEQARIHPHLVTATTGSFSTLDRGYRRHCGPTAITNLILSTRALHAAQKKTREDRTKDTPPAEEKKRKRAPGPAGDSKARVTAGKSPAPVQRDRTAEEKKRVFQVVARLGARKLYYWNLDILHYFGGTSNWVIPRYIRQSFARCHMRPPRVRGPFPAFRRALLRTFARGDAVYLMLFHHKKYGNHHVLATAIEETRDGWFITTADGWSGAPVKLSMKELRLALYYAVGVEG